MTVSPYRTCVNRSVDGVVRLGVDLVDLVDVVKPGSVLRLRDGAIGIRVDSVTRSMASGVVLNSGTLGERKVVHIDGITLHSTPLSAQKDMADISNFAIEHGVDYIATSLASDRLAIEQLRGFLESNGCETTQIIAKIETAQSLRNLEEIIDEADGLLIARGNLGLDLGPEKVALAQSMIISKAKVRPWHWDAVLPPAVPSLLRKNSSTKRQRQHTIWHLAC